MSSDLPPGAFSSELPPRHPRRQEGILTHLPTRLRGISRGRILLSLATSVIITVTAYVSAASAAEGFMSADTVSNETRIRLKALHYQIQQHMEKKGAPPAHLEDLEFLKQGAFPAQWKEYLEDAWGRPFRYETDGKTYDLYTLGADGVPGGQDEDADIHDNPNASIRLKPANFWQFMTRSWNRGVFEVICLVTGVVAFPICLIAAGKGAAKPPPLLVVLFAQGITAVFAILAAIVISALHLSGH
jgi:general secretion pathway protein G